MNSAKKCRICQNIPNTWSVAKVIVRLKPGKNRTKPESYQPIAVLNHYANPPPPQLWQLDLLKKLLNNHDQASFISSRNLSDNIERSLNIINYCRSKQTELVILALDTKKAFDKLEIGYRKVVFKRMDFGSNFL